jgi:hypothetical protein
MVDGPIHEVCSWYPTATQLESKSILRLCSISPGQTHAHSTGFGSAGTFRPLSEVVPGLCAAKDKGMIHFDYETGECC